MLKRKAWEQFENWYEVKDKHALLVDGARQVGKTYLIRKFAQERFENVVEINLFDNSEAARALSTSSNSRELFTRISAFATAPLTPGKTVIFLDEIQEAVETATFIKFLKERNDFDYILSGSLLGVKLKSIASIPVGYLTKITMYPLDFEEYCWASGVDNLLLDEARDAFTTEREIDEFVDGRLKETLYRYLISGGMPAPVKTFIDTNDINKSRVAQGAIADLYSYDISKYAPKNRVHIIQRILELIPSMVSKENKRFIARDIAGDSHMDRYLNDFIWLDDAGVTISAHNLSEPRYPLAASAKEGQFKLFGADVGLLTYQMGMDVLRRMLGDRDDINYGALYESFVAQELQTHGYTPYYYSSGGNMEIDFLVQHPFDKVLPIEVKSGKTYKRHKSLDRALATDNYGFDQGLVLCEGNVERNGKVLYAPLYMVSFL